ncbi:NAD-dependent epimerase/dehydratase family protein [Oerskovia flava]|uniref:NAD-dependent epimerase/dehydratase family protein n=1 Tax=Oerskovia flava TaxID=2986422 RepID=UPI00223FE319|nr:NAD-dependent epimerase/dehydratase family protein [Oerskovia sp. JB1-3-2]
MRVVIVGASGNVGSALLRRFALDPTVTSVVAVASRVPRADGTSTVVPPFDTAHWVRCDLTDPRGVVHERLTEAFAGADAVVHLAWALSPSHDTAHLDRVNLTGTRRVARAAVAAGVPHLVVASCASVYSPVGPPAAPPDDVPRLETWPTEGIATSVLSRSKVAVERMLDELEEDHPELVVTRVRSAFTVQRDAASELTRLLFGRLLAAPLRRSGQLPTLVWPRGLRIQLLHADDAAEGYRQIVVGRHHGGFNLAHDDVLTGADVADVVAGGNLREVAAPTLKRALSLAWHARVAPVEPGWLDAAIGVPVLDSARARALLHWEPVHDARSVLAEMIDGLAQGAGTQSPPLLPG